MSLDRSLRILIVFLAGLGLSSAQCANRPFFVDGVYPLGANDPSAVVVTSLSPLHFNETTNATFGTPGLTVLHTFYAVDDEDTVPFLNFSYDPSATLQYIELDETTNDTTRVAEFRLKEYAEFDYETLDTFKIYAQAFDGVCYSEKLAVIIQVDDVAEPPTLNPDEPVQHFTIQENSAGTVIGSPSFTVEDGDNLETTTWTITNGTGMDFIAINTNNGTITLKTDYDRDNASYAEELDLVIEIRDKDYLSVTVTYSVTITDANDNTPYCDPVDPFNVTSSLSIGTALASINCTDEDFTAPNNEMTYSFWSDDAVAQYFEVIDNGTLQTKYHMDLEYGTGPYTIYMLVTDGGTPARTGTATIVFDLPEATTLPPTTTNVPNPSYDALSSDSTLTALLIVAAFAAACILGYVLILCWRWHTFGKCLPDQCPGRDEFRSCCTCRPEDDNQQNQRIVNSASENGLHRVPEKNSFSLGPEAPNSRRKTPMTHF